MDLIKKITKAVIPVAGLGTRILPLTVHQPKAMVGIADKPMIHYVIDEMLSSGITEFIIVTGSKQEAFRTYLEYLEKEPEWKKLNLKFHFIIQNNPRGNGDAILRAKKLIKPKEAFIVAFPDDIIPAKQSAIKKLINDFYVFKNPAILLEKTPKKLLSRYGVVNPAKKSGNHCRIADIIEKPKLGQAPSDLTIIGRYVLPYSIFKYLEKVVAKTPKNKEAYLTDAFKDYIKSHGPLSGRIFKGIKFDAGSKIGIFKAQAYFSYHHPQFKKEFRKYIHKLTRKK